MTKKAIGYIIILSVILGLSGCASSMMTNQESSKQARIIFEVSSIVEAEKVIESVRGSFNHRCKDIIN